MSALSAPVSVDPNNVSAGTGLIDEGTYAASVTGAKEKTSKAGNNYLEVEFTLSMGRKIWTNFNLWHPDAATRDRAAKEFNKLGVALGVVGQVTDTDQLFGRQLNLVVGVEPRSGDWPAKNIATDFLPSAPTPPPALSPGQPAAQPAPPPPAAAAPWA